jgi:hypothetical protein
MAQAPIRFDDGAAYERAMGIWSQLAGQVFLDWLAPSLGQEFQTEKVVAVPMGDVDDREVLAARDRPIH